MPWTKGDPMPKKKYVNVKTFMEYFDLPKGSAYRILKEPRMKDAVKRIDVSTIRVDLNLAEKILIGG
jgi:hypothetical protein